MSILKPFRTLLVHGAEAPPTIASLPHFDGVLAHAEILAGLNGYSRRDLTSISHRSETRIAALMALSAAGVAYIPADERLGVDAMTSVIVGHNNRLHATARPSEPIVSVVRQQMRGRLG